MISALLTDVSKVLLFPKDVAYTGSLNALYRENRVRKEFSFFEYFTLNEQLLTYYKNISKKVSIHILTSDIIQDDPELQPYWDGVIDRIYSASKMEGHKSDPNIYLEVLQDLKLSSKQVLYLDDSQVNLNAASSVGMTTVLYTDFNSTKNKIDALIA